MRIANILRTLTVLRRARRPAAANGRADAGQGVVRHQLGGPGRTWRLLPGRRRRHLQEVWPRRHHHSRRAQRQQPHSDDLGEDRLLHVGEFAADLRCSQQQHPDRCDRLDVPEGSAGSSGAPGSQREEAGRPEAADAVRLQGRRCELLPVAEVGVRLRREQGQTLHLQPAAVSRRQEERDAGLCVVRAVQRREGGRLQADHRAARRQRLQHLFDPDRDAQRTGRQQARSRPALRRCLDPRLVQLHLRRQQSRQRH